MESDLVTAAATTLVDKLTSQAWQTVVTAIGNLWRRVHPERGDTIEAEATEAHAVALAAQDAGDDEAMADLVSEWRSRLRRLVTDDPQVTDELRQLLAELASTDETAGRPEIGSISMRVKASGRSRVMLAGRDVHVTGL